MDLVHILITNAVVPEITEKIVTALCRHFKTLILFKKGITFMFKIIDFYNAPYEEETTTFKFSGDEWKNSKLFGEEFLIRRIDGIQMLKLTSFNEKDLEHQVPYVIGLGVLDSDNRKPIGNEVAVEFVKRYYRESTQLFSSIMTFAQGVSDMEDQIFENERKNSSGTDSQSSNTNTVNGSDSTQD